MARHKAKITLRKGVELQLEADDRGYFIITEVMFGGLKQPIYLSTKKAESLVRWIVKQNRHMTKSIDPIAEGVKSGSRRH